MKRLKELCDQDKSRTWIHFVGQRTYTMKSFIREAERHGVSRRVAPKVLRNMRWGDLVILAQSAGFKKSAKVFGWFRINVIYALNLRNKLQDLSSKGWIQWSEHVRPISVWRLCGEYTVAAEGLISSSIPLQAIASRLEKDDIPMIGGKLQLLEEPVLVKKLNFAMGFRPFDLQSFLGDWQPRGNYYTTFEPEPSVLEKGESLSLLEMGSYIKA